MDLQEKVTLVAFLGLSSEADFQFHVGSWVGVTSGKSLPVLPEVERLRGVPMLCFYGRNESDAMCRDLDSTLVHSVAQDGGHRIGSNFQGIVQEMLGRLDVRRWGLWIDLCCSAFLGVPDGGLGGSSLGGITQGPGPDAPRLTRPASGSPPGPVRS